MALFQENVQLSNKVVNLELEAKDNKKQILALADDVDLQRKSIEDLFRLSNEFRQEMDELAEKVAELYLMKKQLTVRDLITLFSFSICFDDILFVAPRRTKRNSSRPCRRSSAPSAWK